MRAIFFISEILFPAPIIEEVVSLDGPQVQLRGHPRVNYPPVPRGLISRNPIHPTKAHIRIDPLSYLSYPHNFMSSLFFFLIALYYNAFLLLFAMASLTDGSRPQPVCQNCQTSTTPLWRRDELGSVLCNACGLFLKLHGRPRPISLKTDVIKSRNRVKNSGQALKKAAKVCRKSFPVG